MSPSGLPPCGAPGKRAAMTGGAVIILGLPFNPIDLTRWLPQALAGSAQEGSLPDTVELRLVERTIPAMTLFPTLGRVTVGKTRIFVGTPRESSDAPMAPQPFVHWTSSIPAIATVALDTATMNGVVTGVAPGQVTITAQSGTMVKTTTLQVTAAVASQFTIDLRYANFTPTAAEAALYDQAVSRWTRVVTGQLASYSASVAANTCGANPAMTESVTNLVVFVTKTTAIGSANATICRQRASGTSAVGGINLNPTVVQNLLTFPEGRT